MEINKGGSVRNRFIFISIAIFIFILSLITSLTIGDNSSEQSNLSNLTAEVNLTVDSSIDNNTLVFQTENLSNSLANISNASSNQEILTNTINNNIKTDEKILETPSLYSIVDARTEINRLEDGAFNGIFYPEDTFKFYNNQWYDLISLANISVSNNKLNISYENNYLSLDPYVVFNGNKIKLTNLDLVLFSQVNPEIRILKARNYFKFAVNFSNTGNISEFGFEYQSNVPITSFDNKTFVNGILVIDYTDLINAGYTIFVNDSLIQITNIKNGFNDLDPVVKFNSSAGTKDGAVEGDIGGTGNGTSVFTGGTYQKAGYLVGVDTDLEDRFFLNFNTSSLGKDVQITDVLLWVSVRSKTATCGYPDFTFDVYKGSFIGDSLDTTDYSKGSLDGSVTMQNVDNYTLSLSNSAVNATGDTDIALRPSWIHTVPCNEYLTIYKGNAVTMLRPYLNVTYNQNIYNLTYDANGNLIYGFGKYFEYDGFNRLVRVRNSTNDTIAQYWYDQDGNRIKKVEVSNTGNQTIYYIGNFIQIRNSSGVFNTIYYYDRDSLVGEKRYDGNTYFYHPDHLGSTQLVTNSTGGVVENTSYNPYGEVIQGGNSRYQFTGKELDRETNFEYYGARYYYPYLTRFLQPDILIQDYYNPQLLNRYSYVLNNPYKYVDPSGNNAVLAIAGIGFIAGSFYYMANTPINEQNSGWERVGKAYAMGALTATGAVAASELTFSGGALRLAGGGLTASSILKGSAVTASLDVARQVIAEEKPFNAQSTIISGIAGAVQIPSGGGGQFTGIGIGRNGLYFGKTLFTSQNIDLTITGLYNQLLSNSISNIFNNNLQNNKQNQMTQQSGSGSGGSSSGGYFNWNTGTWKSTGSNSCSNYASCFQQESKKSGDKK